MDVRPATRNSVFQRQAAHELGWYKPHLEQSLELLKASELAPGAAIVDVGGGPSTFVDDLLDLGYSDLTVLDVSETALLETRERLGDRASRVQWMTADITVVALPEKRFDFWHDRAVFHFLADRDARRRYVEALRRSLRPGGHIVVATFGPRGPERCSGLNVVRYSAESLHAELGPAFQRLGAFAEMHTTPSGSKQEFVYCYCRMSI